MFVYLCSFLYIKNIIKGLAKLTPLFYKKREQYLLIPFYNIFPLYANFYSINYQKILYYKFCLSIFYQNIKGQNIYFYIIISFYLSYLSIHQFFYLPVLFPVHLLHSISYAPLISLYLPFLI